MRRMRKKDLGLSLRAHLSEAHPIHGELLLCARMARCMRVLHDGRRHHTLLLRVLVGERQLVAMGHHQAAAHIQMGSP